MKTILTPSLLRFLINKGYQACLSKSTAIHTWDAHLRITLTPVMLRDIPHHDHKTFDHVFAIKAEPVELAKGVKNTEVMVNISPKTLLRYRLLLSHHHTPRQPFTS